MNRKPDEQRVSGAYRDIAKERSPSHIDKRIMSLARQEARTPYGLARSRVRPVAWAATIALSFAFILELTYFREDPLPAASIAEPETRIQDAPVQSAAEETTTAAPSSFTSNRPAAARQRADTLLDKAVDHCDAEARQSAASWYRCVQTLRDQGLDDAANAELAALRETYPDFREPASE